MTNETLAHGFPDTFSSSTPCCGRRVHFPLGRHATDVRQRTCRACGLSWTVVIKPTLILRGEGIIHELSWVPYNKEGA